MKAPSPGASLPDMRKLMIAVAALVLPSVFLAAGRAPAASGKQQSQPPCVPAAQASQQPNHDLCVDLHVYNVVELRDGTRFLDVCPSEVPDMECRFLVLSLPQDRSDVGDLASLRDHDLHLRGTIRPMRGRYGIVLSHVRQLSGGPEKFRPNPRLAAGFSAEWERGPIRDPNLKAASHARSFMNRRETQTLPPH